jgi:hypothetical protein
MILNVSHPALTRQLRLGTAILGLHLLTPLSGIHPQALAFCGDITGDGWVLSHVRTLMLDMESISETLVNLNQLMQLVAKENSVADLNPSW